MSLDDLIQVAKKNHGTYEQMVLAVAKVLLKKAARLRPGCLRSNTMRLALRSMLADLEKEAS